MNRIQSMATGELKAFPDPDVIRGLSRGLNVSTSRVILAAGRSVGFDIIDNDPSELVLQGAGNLPSESKELLISMSRQLQQAHAGPWGGTQDEHELAASKGEPSIDPEENQPV